MIFFFSKPLFTLKRKIELTNIQQYPTGGGLLRGGIISIGEKDKKLKKIKRQENVVVLKYTNK